VVINYVRNQQAAQESQEMARSLGAEVLIAQANVAQSRDRERLVTMTLEEFGRIDLLVNNAGMGPRQRTDMLHMTEQSYDEVMATNLKGPFFLTQRVAMVMIELIEKGRVEDPKVINISSISAYTSSPERAEYCISKAGMSMTTSLWADRLADFGIHVYEIRPGIIETDLTSGVKDKYDRLFEQGVTPIQRWGKPEDIGKAVVSIAEGYLPYSTGEILNVDGGFHLARL
jgi:NAD(P)-dependent dehydrogenase (short-subunit alcohol dehydrogenase family)